MAACSHAVAGPLVPARPGFRELVSVWPASGDPTVVRPVFPGSASFNPAVDPMTAAGFENFVRAETDKYAKLVKTTGAQID